MAPVYLRGVVSRSEATKTHVYFRMVPSIASLMEIHYEKSIKLWTSVTTESMDGVHIWTGIAVEGMYQTMVKDNGHTVGWKGQYFPSLLDKMGQGYATRSLDFSELVRMFLIVGNYIKTSYHGRFYAKAQNLARDLKKMYDDALKDHDVIVMPTLPTKAPKVPKADSSLPERMSAASGMIGNTAPFNVTGHPSLSISVGKLEGLPVGMQITGKMFDDLSVLQVAHVFETVRDEK